MSLTNVKSHATNLQQRVTSSGIIYWLSEGSVGRTYNYVHKTISSLSPTSQVTQLMDGRSVLVILDCGCIQTVVDMDVKLFCSFFPHLC